MVLVATACNSGQSIKEELVNQLRGSCALEAELLDNPVISYEKLVEPKSRATVLESGSFIYRCEKRNGWVAIMYSRPGEKVDCNYRDKGYECPIGWVKDDVITINVD